PAAQHELVDAFEVRPRPHRRAVDGELLPPDAVQCRGWVRAARRAADRDPTAGTCRLEAALPRRLADRLDDYVRAAPVRRGLDGLDDVLGRVIDLHVRIGPRKLLIAR